jgi:hypothetical protein
MISRRSGTTQLRIAVHTARRQVIGRDDAAEIRKELNQPVGIVEDGAGLKTRIILGRIVAIARIQSLRDEVQMLADADIDIELRHVIGGLETGIVIGRDPTQIATGLYLQRDPCLAR